MSPLKIQKSGTHAAGDFSLQFSGIEKYSLCRAIMPRPYQKEAKYLKISKKNLKISLKMSKYLFNLVELIDTTSAEL